MDGLNYKFILLFWLIMKSLALSPGCLFNTEKDLPEKNDPLYLEEKYGAHFTYLLPNCGKNREAFVTLSNGQPLLLACPGRNNYLVNTKKKFSILNCLEENKLLSEDKKEFSSLELYCRYRIVASVKNIRKPCYDGSGVILEIGYELQEFGWRKQLTVCHNIEKSRTYYVQHTLNGASQKAKVIRPPGRPGFNSGPNYFYPGFNPNEAYSVNNQEIVFREILGLPNVSQIIDFDGNKYLSRGHLAPDADFIYASWQMNTYFFINAAPQWQSINGGKWARVENHVRELAIRLDENLEVYTGTSGILNFEDINGKPKAIFLEVKTFRLPVPEYYWKLVYNPSDNSCLGIICTNNPYLKKNPKYKCRNTCKSHNWPIDYGHLFYGFVYCCDYEDMKTVFPEVPRIDCKKPLYFPKKIIESRQNYTLYRL